MKVVVVVSQNEGFVRNIHVLCNIGCTDNNWQGGSGISCMVHALFVSLCLCFCFFNFHLLMGLSSDNYLVKLKNFVRFSQSTQLNKRL